MPTDTGAGDGAWGIPRDSDRTFERHVRAIFEGASIGMSLADASGRILECNPAVTKILGYSQDELKTMSFVDITHPDDRPQEMDLYQQLLRGEHDHYQVDKRYLTKDGRIIWGRLSAALVGGMGGPPATIRVLENITEEKNAQLTLRRYQLLAEHTRDIILFFDAEGCVIEANRAAELAYGYDREELLSLSIQELRYPTTRAEVAAQMAQARGGILFETVHQCKDGRPLPVEVSSRSAAIGDREFYLSIIRDISERKQAEAEISYLNRYDRLTGFYNRAYFEEIMRSYDQSEWFPLSIIMGDLNGLKRINDALGDSYGDQLLVRTAEIIREICGKGVLAARWGDDEFAILLPNTDESEALRLCNRIQDVCYQDQPGPIHPSVALGTATRKRQEESIQEICQAAEARMYRNKFLEEKSPRNYLLAALTRTLRERNLETEEHAHRIEQMAIRMGKAMGLPADKLDELRLLAALHDIGKVGIPDDILMKPGSLTPMEWKTMKTHSEIGYRIAEATPEMVPIAKAILTHHERWDGTGYPLGLKGEEIPLIARIISIIDSYDVMTHDRPYKQAMRHEEAVQEMIRCASNQFDPHLVKEFLRMFDRASGGLAIED